MVKLADSCRKKKKSEAKARKVHTKFIDAGKRELSRLLLSTNCAIFSWQISDIYIRSKKKNRNNSNTKQVKRIRKQRKQTAASEFVYNLR